VLEVVASALAAGVAGGEDHAVVGERRIRVSVQVTGLTERGEHHRSGDPDVGGAVQDVAGVVVEPGQDLAVCSSVESVVGEV
jgi:hypothetical protein